MAILHSCCCWRSVRKGSFASAVYTIVYFLVTAVMMSHFLHEERLYLSGEITQPESDSFLEPETISHTTVTFNILVLCCAIFGILSSFLLIYGLFAENRTLLLPWIFTMISDIIVEVAHNIYLIILETLNFNPITAILYTLDFFLLCLHVYSFLCVVSQYQEYKEGRGTADFEYNDRAPTLQYLSVQPTGTSCLSTYRAGGGGASSAMGGISVVPFPLSLGGDYREHSIAPHVGPLNNTNSSTVEEHAGNGLYKTNHRRVASRKHVQFEKAEEQSVFASESLNLEELVLQIHPEIRTNGGGVIDENGDTII